MTLLALPASYFDHGQSLCLSRLLLDRECPGCGMARACMHALHFEWDHAWNYNRLVVVVLPFLAWLWVKEVWLNVWQLGWLPARFSGD